MKHTLLKCIAVCLLISFSLRVGAQITERKVALFSEGTRISGTVYHPPVDAGVRLPGIILSHGWGGTANLLQPQAERIAQAGYFVLVIDYRGWGESDGRWVRDVSAPDARRELREVVDPMDQSTDIFNAVHWIMGEPQVDTNRVGLWGTSFSGGLIVHVAARDPRIKAIVSQVAWFGQARANTPADALTRAQSDATRRARGEIGYPPPGAREVGNLRGGPVREGFLRYAPISDIAGLKGCATLIIDAGNEELFNLRDHGEAAFNLAPEPKKRVVIPGIAHYGIYGVAREQSVELAIAWFNQHLKGRP